MDELIGRLVADPGADRAAVENAVGIALDFLAVGGAFEAMRSGSGGFPGTVVGSAAGKSPAGLRRMMAGFAPSGLLRFD